MIRVRPIVRAAPLALGVASAGIVAAGCHDVSSFSTSSADHYEGPVIGGDFVRAGIPDKTALCLQLDASQLHSNPGSISSSDGRFRNAPLRPIPQIWHDPLSTLSFGEGRLENLIYVASPDADADTFGDVFVVLSLMQSGTIEARFLRSAPAIGAVGGASYVFAVFPLKRVEGLCSF